MNFWQFNSKFGGYPKWTEIGEDELGGRGSNNVHWNPFGFYSIADSRDSIVELKGVLGNPFHTNKLKCHIFHCRWVEGLGSIFWNEWTEADIFYGAALELRFSIGGDENIVGELEPRAYF